MSIDMSPITADKLQRLDRRRRRFILLRGLCAATVSLLLFLLVVGVVDWLWVLPDAVRWTLSGVGYLSVLLMVWATCLRRIVRPPGPRELARHVEHVEPSLREKLLAAIELRLNDLSNLRDSAAFRRLLQDQVGRQMAAIDVRSLLPLRLLRRWLLGALLLTFGCLALLNVPGLPLKQLMTRALLPGANIDRVSRVRVTILEPTPHSTVAAREEPLAVVVATSGAQVNRVTLETRSAAGRKSRHAMRPLGDAQFSTNMEIGDATLEYRILAGDAVTRWYTIRSRPRPTVRVFRKTFHYPEYARLDDMTVSETNGDLIGLQDTTVQMELELDQEVSTAEIRLRKLGADDVRSIRLEPSGLNRLHAVMHIDVPGVFKIRLISRETGFENTFSPSYEVRPEPDLIPRVGFVNLSDTTLLLPANDIVDLQGLAEDDLPLVRVEQQVSVNGQPWRTRALPIEPKRRITIAWQWDLLDLKLKSGDQVTTRLVAEDRKGNLGESVPLQVVIASADFDPDRHKGMLRKVALYDQLADLAASLQDRTARVTQLVANLDRPDPDADVRSAWRTEISDLVDKTGEEFDRVEQEIKQILPKMSNAVDATEVTLAGRIIVQVHDQITREPTTALELARHASSAEQRQDDLHVIARSYTDNAKAIAVLAERFRVLVSHDILAATILDLDSILQHQRRLVQPGRPLTWQRLVRQETVVANQIRILEQLVRDGMPRLPAAGQRPMLRLLDWARSARESVAHASESEDQLPALRRAAETITRTTPRELSAVPLNGALLNQLTAARKALDRDAGSLFELLSEVTAAVGRRDKLAARVDQSHDSVTSRQLQRDILRATLRLQALIQPDLAVFNALRALILARPMADTRFAADLNLTRRAVVALVSRTPTDRAPTIDVASILAKIAPAYRVLEAGHAIVGIRSSLARLLARERWEAFDIQGQLQSPRQWDAARADLEIAVGRLKAAGYPTSITAPLDRLRWSPAVQEASHKIAMRGPDQRRTVSAVHELMAVQAVLTTTFEQMQPIMAAARAVIAQYVPSIAGMARQTADQLRRLEKKTESLSEDVTRVDRNVAARQMDAVQQEQQAINHQLEDLADALVQDANAQDLTSPSGRQKARDADDSRALVQQAAGQLNRTMQQAAQSRQADQQARNLAQAADQQEQSARTLDQIADHYQKLQAGQDASQSRAALRQMEQALGMQRALDQQYQEAERLGELTKKSPRQLLAELEAELPRNPAMQEALSDISRDTIQQAKNQLDYSADQEKTTRKALERSDPNFQNAKETMTRQLLAIGKKASDLSRTLVAQAGAAAGRADAQDAPARLQQTRHNLTKAASRTTTLDSSQLLEEVTQAAQEMATELTDATRELQQSERATAEAMSRPAAGDDKQRAALQREMETAQRRLRDQIVREARDQVRQLQQQEKRSERDVKTAENHLRGAERQVNQMAVKVRLKPDSPTAKKDLDKATTQWRETQAALARAEQRLEAAKQQTKEMDMAARALQKTELKPLAAPNPAAELANRLSKEAAAAAQALADQARQLANQPDWAGDLAPSSAQLSKAAAAQANIGKDVNNAAADVARAGRHEQRLGKKELGAQLEDAASDIHQVANDDVASAERELGKVAEQTAARQNADTNAAPQHMQDQVGQRAAKQAQEAISQQAESLARMLNPQQATPASSASAATQNASTPGHTSSGQPANASPSPATPSSNQSSPAQARNGQQLARTLDELDQAVAASASASQPASPGPAGPPAGNISAVGQAAQAQAAQMARQRMQDNASPAGTPRTPTNAPAQQSGVGADVANMAETDVVLPTVDRQDDKQWGQLRGKMAEDLVEGQAESVSAEYRKQVQTYFRVIAERARQRRQATPGLKK